MRVLALFGRPAFLRGFHLAATWVWLLLAVPAVLAWQHSVPFLVFVSVYANVVGHWSAWQSTRVEVQLSDDDEPAVRAVGADEGADQD